MKHVGGSIKNKITAPELLEERARCDFDQEELAVAFMGRDIYDDLQYSQKVFMKHPDL